MGAAINAQGRIILPMMTFFRRFATSPIGLAVFAVIIIAFIVTLYEGQSLSGAAGAGGSLASVDGKAVTEAEATRAVQNQLEGARRENPELDMATFVNQGGAERTIDQLINGRALEAFAAANGLIASRKLVDGAIASIPAFAGPNGAFDRTTYLGILSQRQIPEKQLRDDFGREAVSKMLLAPIAGGATIAGGVVLPYASLLLETRRGQIAFVPAALFATASPPSDADVTTFYQRNIARYTVPERRIIKVAQFDRTRFEGRIAPTEAEIATAYKAAAAQYAGRETRTLTQIIVANKSDAEALLARVRGGTPMASAATSLGLEALAVPSTDKAAFAKLTGPRVADAAFAAPTGGVAALAQSGLGYHVVRVEAVQNVAGRTLDQVRGELVASLSKVKVDEALADLVAKIEDDINDGATFDDVVKKEGLTATSTPAITASGLAPDAQGFTLPPELQPLLRDAFQADTGDDPQVASVGNGAAYVLYHMDRVIPAAPRPLGAIKDQVTADARNDRATRAAKRVADAIAAKVGGGIPFAQAMATAGVVLPPPAAAGGRRLDVMRDTAQVTPPLATLFSLAPRRARVIEAPKNAGWIIVYLDAITPGDARQAPPLVAETQRQLGGLVGNEYVEQFVNAIKAKVGVKRNEGAIATFRKSLTGGAAR